MSRSAVSDVVVVSVWCVVAGLLSALAWWQLAPEVITTQTEAGPVLDAGEVARQVGIDGWFAVIALTGGVLSGVALLSWRKQRPLLVVGLVVVGAGLASALMLRVGHLLGPADPATVLEGAPVGATAPLDLALQATGLVWIWPLGAALGAVVQLLVLAPPESRAYTPDDAETSQPVGDSR
jgi:hypothetical protein